MNIFVGDLQNDKDLELYGYSDNTEQYDENGLPLDGTTGYLNSTDNQLTGNLGDDNGYIYGELNRKVEHQTFTGKETETASTYVNNQSDTIEVNVKKTPKKLTIIDGSLVKTFDGSEDVSIEISSVEGYATKADLEAEAALREQADKDITSKLDTEISNRESADNTLSEALETETEERISKDNQLQENITNLDTSIPEKVNQILQQGHYVSDENYVHTDNNFTDDDKTELDTLHQMRINDEFGKVDGVTVNDVEQPIENKIVKLTIDKSTVGLDKVDNTSDKDKPVSDAVQLELDSINTNLSSTQTDLSSFKEETNRNISDINSTITSEVTRINQELQTTTNNINTLDGKVDGHINNQNNPHNVTKEQIGLGNVDNTSDIDKPVSTLQKEAINKVQSNLDNNIAENTTKFNTINTNLETLNNTTSDITTKINEQLTKDVSITKDGDNIYLDVDYKNIGTQETIQQSKQLELASDTQAGLMSMSDYAQIRQNTSDIEQLKAKTVRLLYTDKTDPSAEEINAFVISKGYTLPFEGIAVVIDQTYHIWHYYEGGEGWKDDGQDTVSQFTNTIAGTIKGSEVDGKVYAETDGTGSVKGWGELKGQVTDNTTNLTSHTSNKENPHNVTKTQLGLENVDNTSDVNKPISKAQQTALNNKVDISKTKLNTITDIKNDGDAFSTEVYEPTDSGGYARLKINDKSIQTVVTDYATGDINSSYYLGYDGTASFGTNDNSTMPLESKHWKIESSADKGISVVQEIRDFEKILQDIHLNLNNGNAELYADGQKMTLNKDSIGVETINNAKFTYNGNEVAVKNDIQLSITGQYETELKDCTTYDEVYNVLLNSKANRGMCHIGSASTEAIKDLLPAQPSNFGGSTEVIAILLKAYSEGYIIKFYTYAVGLDRYLYELDVHKYGTGIKVSGWYSINNYLPLTGGTLAGPVVLGQGDANALFLGTEGRINAGTSGSSTIFGLSGSNLIVGKNNYNLKLRGANTRPLYNDAELALKSDIISSDKFVTIDTAQTITGKKTFNDLISINKNGIRVDIGAENTFGVHLYASAGDFFAFNKKLIPNTTNSLGLGDTSNKWSSLYTNTSVNIGSCTQTYNTSTKSLVYSFE